MRHTHESDEIGRPSNEDPVEMEQEVEVGVLKSQILSQTWTRPALHVAYAGLFALAFTTSLAGQTAGLLTPFATSSFNLHSLLAMVQVVQNILYAVVKTPVAKIANTFGRFEAFVLTITALSLGYLQMALSSGVISYTLAQIFTASGFTGLLVLQQIFVADTTDLLNRALFSALPDAPFLVTVWIGPVIADIATTTFTWRAGYGLWVICVPLSGLPLLITLWLNQRNAVKLGLVTTHCLIQKVWTPIVNLSHALDLLGMGLLTLGCSLVLIPLTVTSTMDAHWKDPRIPLLLFFGVSSIIAFGYWESWLASHSESKTKPLVSFSVLKDRTVLAGCCLIFFYDVAFNIFQPYFFSYLMVSRDTSTGVAGKIVQTFSFASTVSAILISLVIRRSSYYKLWMLLGVPVYMAGILLMLFTRTPSVPILLVVTTQLLSGIGGGMISVPTQVGVQASCSQEDVGPATALFLTVFSLGSAVGAAISGAIWTTLLPLKLRTYLPSEMIEEIPKIYADFSYARQTYPDIDSPERKVIIHAYSDVMTLLVWTAFIATIPLAISALFMKNYNLHEQQQVHEVDSNPTNVYATGPIDDINLPSKHGRAPSYIVIGSHADRTADGDSVVSWSDEEAAAMDAGISLRKQRPKRSWGGA
ncbi:major facilitator superfamily domain-containing protein [Dipodascopsis uninucleata]